MPPHRRDRPVDTCRKDAIPVVEDEPVGRLRSHDRAKLLDRPLGSRMLGDIPVEDPTRADLEGDEHIEDAEAGGHHREEVTGYDRVRRIPHKRGPALRSPPAVPRTQTPGVPTHRARRHSQSQFDEQFARDPFLTPGRVRPGHAHDESLQVPGNWRPCRPQYPYTTI